MGDNPKGAQRAVAAARGTHGHLIGVSLCKVQSPALHEDRWWPVALDGVGNTPLGPGGVPPFVALPWSWLIQPIPGGSIRSTSESRAFTTSPVRTSDGCVGLDRYRYVGSPGPGRLSGRGPARTTGATAA